MTRLLLIGLLLVLAGCSSSGSCPMYYWNVQRDAHGETGSIVCGSVSIRGCENAYVLNGKVTCFDLP